MDTDKQTIETILTRSNIGWTISEQKHGLQRICVSHDKGPSDSTVDLIFDGDGQLVHVRIGDIWED